MKNNMIYNRALFCLLLWAPLSLQGVTIFGVVSTRKAWSVLTGSKPATTKELTLTEWAKENPRKAGALVFFASLLVVDNGTRDPLVRNFVKPLGSSAWNYLTDSTKRRNQNISFFNNAYNLAGNVLPFFNG